MNSLYTSNKAIFSQLFLGIVLLSHSLHGITVNNTPLEQITKSKQAVIITPKEDDRLVSFEMMDDNLDIIYEDINCLKNLKKVFEELNTKKSGGIISKECILSSNTINYNGSYLVGKELINIEAKTALNLNNCLLESPKIIIEGNQMNFGDCFLINPQVLYIIANSPESNCGVIRITFDEESTHPTLITGEVNLKNNQTSRRFMITNVKKIEIQFASKAWEN